MIGDNPYAYRGRSAGILAVGMIFIAFAAAASTWLVHSYVNEPKQITLPPGTAGRIAGEPAVPFNSPAVGAVVRNQQGDGIPNVRVRLNWNDASRPQGQTNQSMILATDALGRWSYAGVPEKSLTNLNIWLTHRDYVPLNPKPGPAALLSRNGVIVMTHGLDINGTVVDSLGWPVSNASVTAPSYGPGGGQPRATTNDQGQFTLHHIPPNIGVVVTVKHAGFAAAVAQIQSSGKLPPLKMTMPTARMFAGHVMDLAGKPVPDVTVTVQQWNGITQPGNVQVNTNAQGGYEIRDVPQDAIDVQISKNGIYNQTRQLAAGVDQLDFTVSPVVTARGRVTDAKTHQPIAAFKLTVGMNLKPDQPAIFDGGATKDFNNGRYNITFDGLNEAVDAWFVRIEAKGYAAMTSPPFTATGRHDFEMKPAAATSQP